MIIGKFDYSNIVNCTVNTILVSTKCFLWKASWNNKKFNNIHFSQQQFLSSIRMSLNGFVAIKLFNKSIAESI